MRRAKLILWAGLLAACSADDRQLVVVVNSDLNVPTQLANVDVRVEDDAGSLLAERTFALLGTGGNGVPFSFGVAPHEAGAMTIVVQARGPNLPRGFPAVRRRVESLPAGRSGLAIYLSEGCAESSCAGDQTCLDTLCGPIGVANTELVPLTETADELGLACSASKNRCSSDGLRISICGVLGQAPTEVPCPDGTRCNNGRGRCEADNASTRRVDVEVNNPASGRVISNPVGIHCGLSEQICTAEFPRDSTVTLNAEPSVNGLFMGWSGDCQGSGPCVLQLSEHRSVAAAFTSGPPEGFDLQIDHRGDGVGQVRFLAPPDQLPCDTDCTRRFASGTRIQLEATPSSGSRFQAWSGACGGNTSCIPDTSGTEPVRLEATFERTGWNIRFSFRGPGEAELTLDSISVCTTDSGPCEVLVPVNSTPVLAVTPGPATRVVGFTGLCQASGPTCTFSPEQDGEVTIELASGPSRFDLDGDGVDEVLLGAPGWGRAGASGEPADVPGRLYLVTGPIPQSGVMSVDSLWGIEGEMGDQAGRVFAFPGDLDGDGLPDLLVGSPEGSGGAGVVYVIGGNTGLSTRPSLKDMAIADFRGATATSRLGASLAVLPDQNDDGLPEFAIGVPGDRQVQIMGYDVTSRTFVTRSTLDAGGLELRFGAQLASPGDLSGDGVPDLVVAAPDATVNGVLFAGAVHVFTGPFNQQNIAAATSRFRIVGPSSGYRVGAAIAGGVGFVPSGGASIAVAAGTGTNNRRVSVFGDFASNAPRDIEFNDLSFTPITAPTGASVRFGTSLLFVGDVLAAGGPTLLVGDPENGGVGRGAVVAVPRPGSAGGSRLLLGGDCAGQPCTENRFGASLGPIADLDGDGIPDFAVGALWGGGGAGQLGRGRSFFFRSSELRNNRNVPAFVVEGEDLLNGRCLGLGPPF